MARSSNLVTSKGGRVLFVRRRRDHLWTLRQPAFEAFLNAYNFAKRLKTLKGLTPYEHICNVWADQPSRFRYDPLHLTSGLNT